MGEFHVALYGIQFPFIDVISYKDILAKHLVAPLLLP
jgi:hypothetical protein